MDVGVRELKARLSEYLDRAEAGEVIRVTERGRPKALLVAVPGAGALAEGIAAGFITKGSDDPPHAVRRQRASRTVAEVLADDREDP